MADPDETIEEEEREDVEEEKSEKMLEKTDEKASGGISPWIIVFVVVVLCGGAGFDFE